MLGNTLGISIGSQAYTLVKKNQDNYGSTYMDNTTVAGTEVKLIIKNADEGKPKITTTATGLTQSQMERHIADLTVTKTDSNGFRKTTQTYIHTRNLKGSTVADVADVTQALCALVTTLADSLIAWES